MAEGTQTSCTPSLISWNLTKKCNLRCPHCYMEAGRSAEQELSTEECFGLLDEMRSLGTEMVILTGGEPLLRRDIYDIARYASDLGLWVVMGTNGVLVDDRVAQRMVECGIKGVGISIDSIDPAKHDSFRGGPDAWKYSVRALEICRAHGLQVLVQTTGTLEVRQLDGRVVASFPGEWGGMGSSFGPDGSWGGSVGIDDARVFGVDRDDVVHVWNRAG